MVIAVLIMTMLVYEYGVDKDHEMMITVSIIKILADDDGLGNDNVTIFNVMIVTS